MESRERFAGGSFSAVLAYEQLDPSRRYWLGSWTLVSLCPGDLGVPALPVLMIVRVLGAPPLGHRLPQLSSLLRSAAAREDQLPGLEVSLAVDLGRVEVLQPHLRTGGLPLIQLSQDRVLDQRGVETLVGNPHPGQLEPTLHALRGVHELKEGRGLLPVLGPAGNEVRDGLRSVEGIDEVTLSELRILHDAHRVLAQVLLPLPHYAIRTEGHGRLSARKDDMATVEGQGVHRLVVVTLLDQVVQAFIPTGVPLVGERRLADYGVHPLLEGI